MTQTQEKLTSRIDGMREEISRMCDEIFTHPEIGRQEFFAQKLLCDFLISHGFAVEQGVGGIPTSFRTVWEQGSGGPSVGLLCEYDALKGFGHGCGHHMQGPAILAAAVAVKELWGDAPLKLVVYGTPDEELGEGKVTMIQNGCFEDIDFALMTHVAPDTTVDIKSLAMNTTRVRFHGKAAHAAIKPEDGRSAVDALMLAIHGFELLREHVRSDVRLHYVIDKAGETANVVPDFAEARFVVRSYSGEYVDRVWKRMEKIMQGAALMTETTAEVEILSGCQDKIPVMCLNETMMGYAKELNAPQIIPYREQTGSTDFGNVLHRIPGAQIRVAFVPRGTSSHSQAYLDAGMSQALYDAAVLAAKILALTTWDLGADAALRENIQRQFTENLAKARQEAAL